MSERIVSEATAVSVGVMVVCILELTVLLASLSAGDGAKRTEYDFEVELQTPFLDILKIKPHSQLERGILPRSYLPETSYAGFDFEATAVINVVLFIIVKWIVGAARPSSCRRRAHSKIEAVRPGCTYAGIARAV